MNSISQKLNNYNPMIENIMNEKNHKSKIMQIGALVFAVGGRCIKAISDAINCSRKFVKKCFDIFVNHKEIKNNRHNSGRKKITDKYPNLIKDINIIMKNNIYSDPHFISETCYTNLTTNDVYSKLIETGKYSEGFIGKSTLADLLNKIGYSLKKIKRNMPLRKIPETSKIFENVKKRKEEAMNDKKTALLSIDTKDKVMIGPYSRKGRNRIQINACDHELTNDCIVPFGILDLKNDQTYFYNFKNHPTSNAIVDCIEDYIKQNDQYDKYYILLDNGPDCSGVRTAFLKGLVDLAKKYNKKIILTYYPPYHSKYNPVERIWSRLEQLWNGLLLINEDICNNIMKNLTWKGVKAKVKTINKTYEKGIKYSKKEMKKYEGVNIIRNKVLKKWDVLITT